MDTFSMSQRLPGTDLYPKSYPLFIWNSSLTGHLLSLFVKSRKCWKNAALANWDVCFTVCCADHLCRSLLAAEHIKHISRCDSKVIANEDRQVLWHFCSLWKGPAGTVKSLSSSLWLFILPAGWIKNPGLIVPQQMASPLHRTSKLLMPKEFSLISVATVKKLWTSYLISGLYIA